MYTVSAAIFFTLALESIFVPISVLLIALVQYLVPVEHVQIKWGQASHDLTPRGPLTVLYLPKVIGEKSPLSLMFRAA